MIRAALRRAAGFLAALCLALACALSAAIAAAVVWTVCARFVFQRAPAWSEELPRVLMVWAVFLGAVWTTWRGTNLESGLLAMWARNRRLRAAARAVSEALVACFCLLLAATGAEMAEITWDGTTPALEATAAVFYLPVAIGGALAALVQVPRLLDAGAEALGR